MRLHIFVSGKVQGVFYRKFVLETAQELGVKGWCKNTDDGKVEMIIEAGNELLLPFITTLKQGSEDSEVENIQIEEQKEKSEFTDFEIR